MKKLPFLIKESNMVHFSKLKNIVQDFKDRGAKFLGSGDNGVVYAIDGEVVKFTNDAEEISITQKMVKLGKNLPGLHPRYKLTVLDSKNAYFFMADIDRLDKSTISTLDGEENAIIGFLEDGGDVNEIKDARVKEFVINISQSFKKLGLDPADIDYSTDNIMLDGKKLVLVDF